MKRFLIALQILSLACLVACRHERQVNTHVNTHVNARTGQKSVTIAISDDGSGGFVLEASVPNKAYLKKGHKVHWVVINNTEAATVTSVLIDRFLDAAGNKDPFEGAASDQKFSFPTISPGDESELMSNKTKMFPPGPPRSFKYYVTVNISGVGAPLVVDPVVVVGD